MHNCQRAGTLFTFNKLFIQLIGQLIFIKLVMKMNNIVTGSKLFNDQLTVKLKAVKNCCFHAVNTCIKQAVRIKWQSVVTLACSKFIYSTGHEVINDKEYCVVCMQ